MQAQEKRAHVETWRISGQTKAAYARKYGINSKTLSRWCQQYPLASTGKPSLAAVSIQSTEQSPTQTAIQLQLRSGNTLELPIDTSPRWLGELLQCLD